MTRKFMYLLGPACVAFGFAAGMANQRSETESGPPAKMSALTITGVTRMAGSSGEELSFLTVFASRADGSSVDLRLMGDGKMAGNKAIFDLTRGQRVVVDPLSESTTTYALAPPEISRLRLNASSCVGIGGSERGEILGVEVVKIERRPPPSGNGNREEIEEWLAPSLNCYPLRRTATLYNSGRRLAVTTQEATSITLGEPDEELFAVPAGYAERTPSEVYAERARRQGRECPTCGGRSVLQHDLAYRAAQPR